MGYMPDRTKNPWRCFKCDCDLQPGRVNVSYLGSSFPVELLKCPQCGLVLITEDLARGKMVEVERTLEDK
ncbi:hypothetical protein JOC37_001462 [Desulfohalotomaculum tongense]|uniref:DVU_1557 family redox protein n=1 Tax=Desulforadius tongensis TaxID=1216062 RepID=UPI0019577EEA|nr:CLJU_RS11820 family redox protein [Desulforadius tongensis]MBM7855079.1 hypothetical protein [Desulforadius tongensis]